MQLDNRPAVLSKLFRNAARAAAGSLLALAAMSVWAQPPVAGPKKLPPAAGSPAPATGVAQCAAAQAALPGLSGTVVATVSITDRSAAEATAMKAVQRGRSEATGYDEVAAGAFLKGRMDFATWAALEAAKRQWNARRATNAGVALAYVGQRAAAEPFVACARALDPASVFALEAQAMLAYWRKDCATASSLLDQAVAAAPRDMNVHYSAGAVHYSCGDRRKAAEQLAVAVEIAPTDPVVGAALNAAAPGGAGAASPGASKKVPPMPPAVRRQVDEALRFMDDAIVIAKRAGAEELAIEQISVPGTTNDNVIDGTLEELQQTVANHKRLLSQLEQQMALLPAGMPPALVAQQWNGVLDESIRAYFEVTRLLYEVTIPDDQVRRTAVMAAALGTTPTELAERIHDKTDGDFVIQDAMSIYDEATRPINGVARPCSVMAPAYEAMVKSVQANLNNLVGGFPSAAAQEATTWLRYARQAADYAHRTSTVMVFPSQSARDQEIAYLKEAYDDNIREDVLKGTADALSAYQQDVLRMEAEDTRDVADQKPIECYGSPPKAVTLADALAAILDALKTAGTYDASFESPDCTLTFGSVSLSCKPAAFQGVKASWNGPVTVSATAGGERWGVDASAGPLSGSSGGSTRFDLASSKISDSAYGVEASVGVSSWIERNASGQADVYMEAKGSLGVGVDAEGVGSVSCEFFQASAQLNLRAFAGALVQ